MRSQLVHRHIKDKGDPVVVRVYTKTTDDSYGDAEFTYVDTDATAIRSVLTNTKVPFIRGADTVGMYNTIDVEFFLSDTVTIPNPQIVGEDMNEIIWRGETYGITDLEDSKIGAHRAMCRRKRI
jgi:hypothetical protein